LSSRLAILGGKPTFETTFPFVKPSADRYTDRGYLTDVERILKSGKLSGVNFFVAQFEYSVADYLDVSRAVAVGSNTSGLILCLAALGIRDKRVLLPSFTFGATALAPYWNRNSLSWIDVDDTLTISEKIISSVDLQRIDLILGVHIFGNPCACGALAEAAESGECHIVYDSAHGLGSCYKGSKVGKFGDAEIFSLSSTKLVTTFEGGIVATSDDDLADRLSILRNYGNLPDYSCEMPGLNARMPEMSAALGLRMLEDVDMFVRNRNEYCDRYERNLRNVPGVSFQRIREGCLSSRKDFAIVVLEEQYGISRDVLALALEKENILTKKYFHPPLHELEAYKSIGDGEVPNTERLSRDVLCLPIHNFMSKDDIDSICECIEACFEESERIMCTVSEKKDVGGIGI